MRHVLWKVDGQEYKLRLGVSEVIALERRMGGRNPMDMMMNIQQGRLPSTTAVLAVIHASMQKFNHGITIQDVEQIYGRYLKSGGTFTDLIPTVLEVFEDAGFFKSNPEVEATVIEDSPLLEEETIEI